MDLKKILDVLAIALPFILIVFGFLRVDSSSQKSTPRIKLLNGLTMLIAVVLLLIGGIRYFFFPSGGSSAGHSNEKPLPMAVSKHSDAFNKSVSSVLTAYYNMTEAFVNWDSAAINKYANELKTSLGNLNIDELKSDSNGIYESALDPLTNAKAEATSMLSSPGIDKKLTSLNALSEDLRLLFIVVKYDREKLYWQECPMAFGEDKPGNWLSKTTAVRNPYLGNNSAESKDKLLQCGEPKDTINFIPADTTASKK